MPSLLLSNIKPVSSNHDTFTEKFEELFLKSENIRIATGYISVQSLLSLEELMNIKPKINCQLIVGMCGRDGISKSTYQTLENFNQFVSSSHRGEVSICSAFPFHGKIYSFQKQKPFASIIGSSNLSNIVKLSEKTERIYEVDVLEEDTYFSQEVDTFLNNLLKGSNKFTDWKNPKIFSDTGNLLEGHIGVDKVNPSELSQIISEAILKNKTFNLPLKTEEKSNLNIFFGKGRENKSTGIIRNRPWYEVELIVPKAITLKNGYPLNRIITVYTDDGWKFKCKTSGDYSKNFRSEDDLLTLGKWIKGRLEASGSLKIKQKVDDQVLSAYGRKEISLKATKDPNVWYLDFS